MRVVFAVGLVALLVAPLSSARTRVVTDGSLTVAVPDGWSSSVAPGTSGGRGAAWMLIGSFALDANAALQEGGPAVPRGRVLVAIGDVPVAAQRWPQVDRVQMPGGSIHRVVVWHVRYRDRALTIELRFGSSKPTARLIHLAARELASIRRR